MSYYPHKGLKLVCKVIEENFTNFVAYVLHKSKNFSVKIQTQKFLILFNTCVTDQFQTLMGIIGHHNANFDIKQYLVYRVSVQENWRCTLKPVFFRLTMLYQVYEVIYFYVSDFMKNPNWNFSIIFAQCVPFTMKLNTIMPNSITLQAGKGQ